MVRWTNPSVLAFSGSDDPIGKIQEAARGLALSAMERGWQGPPYNPVQIAELLGAKVVPNYDIADARTIQVDGAAIIEFNPSQARERVRFSIAHEAAHLLFSDALHEVRHRGGTGISKDEWQLELLCNLAAAEFVMPVGSFAADDGPLNITELMKLRVRFDVSAEAFMIRVAKTSRSPIGIFCASPYLTKNNEWSYRIDYYIPSPIAPHLRIVGHTIPKGSAVYRCTAIGFTDSAREDWLNGRPYQIEYVGIPGYPGASLPRALGLVHFSRSEAGHEPIKYVHGNALEPRGEEHKIICQLVNDRASKWGGGIAHQTAKLYPEAEQSFSRWISEQRKQALGNVHIWNASDALSIASLVAQAGFGPAAAPRIRYGALKQTLTALRSIALEKKATLHMPRIGTGAAGGDWTTIENLIQDELVSNGVRITVYDPPPKRQQLELF